MRRTIAFLVVVAGALVVMATQVTSDTLTNKGGLKVVSHDTSLSGSGTAAAPLKIRADCALDQVLAWDSDSWECSSAAAGGDITSVGATSNMGLTGGASSGAALLGLISTCANGEVLKSGASGTTWSCASDSGALAQETSIIAQVSCNSTEVVVASLTIPANTIAAGTTYTLTAGATQTGANAAAPVFRVRLGPTTLTGAIIGSITGNAGTGTLDVFVGATVTARSTTSMLGTMHNVRNGTAAADTIAAVTIDATVQNYLEFTCASGNAANTYLFELAQLKRSL